ncbi:unnamed protein product [Effrenium voratum]|nr:unnamed protein product [Effrenium voratum]
MAEAPVLDSTAKAAAPAPPLPPDPVPGVPLAPPLGAPPPPLGAPAPPPAPTIAGVPAPQADPNHIDPAWEVPTSDETALPREDDGESWLELLRDGYFRQIREENEYKQPPPFPRAMHFAAVPGHPLPENKYPRQALDLQRSMLAKFRPDPVNPGKGKHKGGFSGMDMMYGWGDGWSDWDWGWGMGWGMKGGFKGKGGMGKKGMPY